MWRNKLPDREVLNKYLHYNKKTGILSLKERTIEDFKHCKYPEKAMKSWNARNAGLKFGSDSYGFRVGKLNGQRMAVHRIIWKLEHNTDPEYVHHIDGDYSNNRIENLTLERRIYSNNTSGILGVSFHKPIKKWTTRVQKNKKIYDFGYFNTVKEAAEALRIGKEKLNEL